ncbi:SnoaL-like domain protein [Pirellulimonas nuda]|uniref:SnoaL-like domain protein n=1 Tax=Pirellulimonas nuda TaxID=2528009 RepID=A0A518DGS5_9BACT|nr:SgcJ/EcaC family oxidoreductase [Pirellulimonas nuda]QDU90680.1 SnoaL-like domain protein [Pirellulimonas nuda]
MSAERLRNSLLPALFLALAVSFAPGLAWAQDAAPSTMTAADANAPAAAIRAAGQAFVVAFNRQDAKGVAALWTADGEYVDEQGVQTVGRDAIEKQYADFFAANPGARIEIVMQSVKQITPDAALESGSSTLLLAKPAGATSRGQYVAAHAKQDGKWLMASVRETPAVDVAPANANLSDLAWLTGRWAADKGSTHIEIAFDPVADGRFLLGQTTLSTDQGSSSGGTQVVGRDPLTGQLVSWFFNTDGGHGFGVWSRDGDRWLVRTVGVTGQGAPTRATNILYNADDKVHSWQSVDRSLANQPLSDTEEVVIERVSNDAAKPK